MVRSCLVRARCVVSGSLNRLVPKLMISLLNGLLIEFIVIPSIGGQVGTPKWSQLELNYQNFIWEFKREQQ